MGYFTCCVSANYQRKEQDLVFTFQQVAKFCRECRIMQSLKRRDNSLRGIILSKLWLAMDIKKCIGDKDAELTCSSVEKEMARGGETKRTRREWKRIETTRKLGWDSTNQVQARIMQCGKPKSGRKKLWELENHLSSGPDRFKLNPSILTASV